MGQLVSLGRMVVQCILPYFIKKFPFMALYGYHHPSITSHLKGKVKVQVVEEHIDKQQEVLKLLKENFVISQNRMKQQAYQHCNKR
jgi:hypothetical protein